MAQQTIRPEKENVAVVCNVNELPTYYDYHGKRQIKILFDDDFCGAKNVAMEYITYQPGDEVRMGTHDDAEHAFIVLKGSGFFECDTGRYPIGEGSVMFIPKGANHRIGNNSDKEMVFLELFAPPTDKRKTGLSTCYNIPQWEKYFDKAKYDAKHQFAKERDAKRQSKEK